MCRPPEDPANIRKHTARRSVPATFVGCVQPTTRGMSVPDLTQVKVVDRLLRRLQRWNQWHKGGKRPRLDDDPRSVTSSYNGRACCQSWLLSPTETTASLAQMFRSPNERPKSYSNNFWLHSSTWRLCGSMRIRRSVQHCSIFRNFKIQKKHQNEDRFV